MSDLTKSSLAWHPAFGAHAIEQTAFVVQFNSQISQENFTAAREVAKGFDFPKPQEVISQNVIFVAQDRPPLVQPSIAIVFQKFQIDGQIETELRFDGASMAFRTIKYSRWEKVWGEGRKYFNALLPLYSRSAVIGSIGLQYSNKFIFSSSLETTGVDSLLREDSPFLSPYIHKQTDLWHSYTGAFIRHNDYIKRLLNVNVDKQEETMDEEVRQIVRINTSLTDMFHQPNYASITVTEENVNDLCNTQMESLHVYNKEIIAQIVSGAMEKRLDLWAA